MRKFAFVAALVAVILAGATAPVVSASAQTKNTTKQSSHKQADTARADQQATEQTAAAAPQPVIVTVAPGDTLSAVAAAHQTTYVRIFDANSQVVDPDVIDVGWQLTIPTADQQLPDRYGAFMAQQTAAAPVPVVTTASVTSTYQPAAVYAPVSGNAAKAFIYAHESGDNPNATSPNGCYGLGQDCNGHVRAQCGSDYACQDAYFDNYATSRYGSWSGAQAFWQTHGWW